MQNHSQGQEIICQAPTTDKPRITKEIEFNHHGKLGITIIGGIGSEYYRNDPGIFIIRINQNQIDKGLQIGDRLLQISSTHGSYNLRLVTREDANKFIQSACAESQKIKLCIERANSFQREETNMCTVHNERDQSMTIISDDELLIMQFDYADYQRYENRGKLTYNPLSKCRRHTEIKPTTRTATTDHVAHVEQRRNSKINNSDSQAAREMRLREAIIRDAKAEKQRRKESKKGQQARLNRSSDDGLRWQID